MDKLTLPVEVTSKVSPEVAEALMALASPVAEFDFGDAATEASQSYAAGHPFFRPGDEWPMGEESEKPMVFLLQVNFADLPEPLPGFPTEGLVQWFVDGADDTFGLTFYPDATGREGLELRYISAAEVQAGSVTTPQDSLPYSFGEEAGPLERLEPRSLIFTVREIIPHWTEYYEGARNGSVEEVVKDAVDELQQDSSVEDKLSELMAPEFSVGGRPVLVQTDPRGGRTDQPAQVFLQLGSDGDVFMWGDAGTAQIFASPEAVAKGDVSEAWWDWACYSSPKPV